MYSFFINRMTCINLRKIYIGFFSTLFLILIICLYRLYKTPTIIPTNNLADFDFQTGDLLFIRYVSKWSKVICIGSLVDISHTAFIYKKDGEIFIIEMSNYTNYDEPDVEKLKGLCIVPLKKWLILNDGRICGYRKCKTTLNCDLKINSLLEKYKNINLDMNLLNWMSVIFNTPNRFITKNDYYCSEFIALLLQKLDILDTFYDPSFYSPAKLSKIKGYFKIKYFNIDL